jgi:transposase-like protein
MCFCKRTVTVIPEQQSVSLEGLLMTRGFRSALSATGSGAAIKEIPELAATDHVTVSALKRQNNLIEQSHRPTRDQERQQRGFRTVRRTQAFLFTHAEVGDLFRYTRARTPARMRRRNWGNAFRVWDKLSLSLP